MAIKYDNKKSLYSLGYYYYVVKLNGLFLFDNKYKYIKSH